MSKRTQEQVYDEEIAPLMKQIIDICERNKMAMVASFHCPGDEDSDPDRQLMCTTLLAADEYHPPASIIDAAHVLMDPSTRLTAVTIFSSETGDVH